MVYTELPGISGTCCLKMHSSAEQVRDNLFASASIHGAKFTEDQTYRTAGSICKQLKRYEAIADAEIGNTVISSSTRSVAPDRLI